MDVKKFSQMLTIYKDKMFRYAYSIVGSTFAAEDVVQEALIKIWKNRARFEDVDNKEAWCVTVTRNVAIDKIRKEKKKRTSNIDDHFNVSDRGPSPDVSLEQKDALLKVRELLNQLPELQKDIITLRDIEGYTYQEIADILKLSVNQVKVTLHRARKSLRSQLLALKGQVL